MGGPGRPDGGLAHLLPQPGGEGPGGGLLDQLLILPLDGAVPLPQMDHIALGVGQDLKLDVAGVEDQLLHIQLPVAEAGHCLRLGGLEQGRQVLRPVHPAHPAASAAGRGLHQHGVVHLVRHPAGLLQVHSPLGARDHGHAGAAHQRLGRRLAPHLPNHVAGGTDKLQPALGAQVGKVRIFREEAVSGMDSVTACLYRRRQDGGLVQIAFRCPGRTDAHRPGGQLDMEGVPVGDGVHRHCLDLQLPAGPDDPHRDLAPVGDQNPPEHFRPPGCGTWGRQSPPALRPSPALPQ